jgi:hypothetical protein
MNPMTFCYRISHQGEEWEPSGGNHKLFIFSKNHCLASAIHVSNSICLLGETYKRGRDASSGCLLAGALQIGTWFYFLDIFILILKERKTTLLQETKT